MATIATKDWIADTAAEIKKRGSTEIEVVTSIIKRRFSLKLRTNPLDGGPITTMAVPRCDHCAQWRRLPERVAGVGIGLCSRHSDQISMLRAFDNTRRLADVVETHDAFGCIEFDAAEGVK